MLKEYFSIELRSCSLSLAASSVQTLDKEQRDKLISSLKDKQLLDPDSVPEATLLSVVT